MKIYNYPIRKSFLVILTVIIIIASAVAGLVNLLTEKENTIKHHKSTLQYDLEIYQGVINSLVKTNNTHLVRRLLTSMATQDGFVRSWVTDNNDLVVASSNYSSKDKTTVDILNRFGYSYVPFQGTKISINDNYLLGATEIISSRSQGSIIPDLSGRLWIIFDLKPAFRLIMYSVILKTIFMASIFLVSVAVFSYLMYTTGYKRINQINHNIALIGKNQNEKDLIQIEGKDEIASIGTAVTIMAERIQSQQKEMLDYIDTVDNYVIISKTNPEGYITYVSEAFCRISEFNKEDLIGQKHSVVRHPDMPEHIYKDLWDTISQGGVWEGEIKNRKKHGGFYWVRVKITPTFNRMGKITEFTAIRQDITSEKLIEQLSITDELTGLYNRRHFHQQFKLQLNSAIRDKSAFGFAIADVDNFKKYNDTYGHSEGDRCLKAVSKILKQTLSRPRDMVFRLGGEEFGLLFELEILEHGKSFGELLNDTIMGLGIPHTTNPPWNKVTISIGICICQPDLDSTEDMIYNLADQALYKAKENGRNRTEVTSLY